jgi:branched-chain amino acid aminotransferase
MLTWLNGRLLDASAARIVANDRGLLLGHGCFETIRIQNGAPAHLSRHLARLRNGASLLRIPIDLPDIALAGAITAIAVANVPNGAGSARLTLTAGPGPRGLAPPATQTPTILITAGPAAGQGPPPRLVIATAARRAALSPLSRIKSLNYADNLLARFEAIDQGADDALLRNEKGDLACATAACLFILEAGRLLTPPVTDGALPGILRALLIERAGVGEATLTPDRLRAADAILLGNALGLRPVADLDGAPLEPRPDLAADLWRLSNAPFSPA